MKCMHLKMLPNNTVVLPFVCLYRYKTPFGHCYLAVSWPLSLSFLESYRFMIVTFAVCATLTIFFTLPFYHRYTEGLKQIFCGTCVLFYVIFKKIIIKMMVYRIILDVKSRNQRCELC